MLARELRGPTGRPICHFQQYGERLLVASQDVHVIQARHDLVDGVKRRPDWLAALQTIQEFERESAQIAARQRGLARGQLGHYLIALGLHSSVACSCVQLRASRKEMTREVAAQFAIWLLPTTQGLRRRR